MASLLRDHDHSAASGAVTLSAEQFAEVRDALATVEAIRALLAPISRMAVHMLEEFDEHAESRERYNEHKTGGSSDKIEAPKEPDPAGE
jgi:hypothetical protein